MLACCSFSSNATTIGVVTEHLIKKKRKRDRRPIISTYKYINIFKLGILILFFGHIYI